MSSCGVGLESEQKVVGYSYNSCAIIKRKGTSCHAVHFCSLQDSQLCKASDVFLLPDSFMAA